MDLIQQLLRNPHQPRHVAQLVGLEVDGYTVPLWDGAPAVDETTLSQLQAERQRLLSERERIRQLHDLSREEAIT